MNTLENVLRNVRAITITPIAKQESNKPSRLDYNHQRENEIQGFDVMWDDTASNDTKVGDKFAFVFGAGSYGNGEVEIRTVERILPQSARDDQWKIPKHTNRQVLVLSEVNYQTTWVDFCQQLGRKTTGRVDSNGTRTPPLQGTTRKIITKEVK